MHVPNTHTCAHHAHAPFPPNNSHSVFYLSKKGSGSYTAWRSTATPSLCASLNTVPRHGELRPHLPSLQNLGELPTSTFCILGHFCKDNRQDWDKPTAHNTPPPPLWPGWIKSNPTESWAVCSASIVALTNIPHPPGATRHHLPSLLHTWLCPVLMIPSRPCKGQAQKALGTHGATHHTRSVRQKLQQTKTTS